MLLPGESEKEWEQLQSQMMSDYCPSGDREIRRVGKIAWSEWRLRRGRRGEAGELAKLLADHDTRAEMVASTHVPQYNQAVADLAHLKLIEEQINSEGRVSPENLDWLRKLPYQEAVKYFLDAIELVQSVERGEGARPNPAMPAAGESRRPTSATNAATREAERDVVRELLLNVLDSLKHAIQGQQLYHGQNMIRRAEAQRNALLIPQEAILNRIIRCESHILRNIEKDENALERMQRRGLGEYVPPPSARVN
jgi:hypothetical protein